MSPKEANMARGFRLFIHLVLLKSDSDHGNNLAMFNPHETALNPGTGPPGSWSAVFFPDENHVSETILLCYCRRSSDDKTSNPRQYWATSTALLTTKAHGKFQGKLLYVDYHQGSVGQSVGIAYHALKGPSFPTLIQEFQQNYLTQRHIGKAVCHDEYWGAI